MGLSQLADIDPLYLGERRRIPRPLHQHSELHLQPCFFLLRIPGVYKTQEGGLHCRKESVHRARDRPAIFDHVGSFTKWPILGGT